MASMMSATMETAKHIKDSAQEGVEHAMDTAKDTAKHVKDSAKEGVDYAVESAKNLKKSAKTEADNALSKILSTVYTGVKTAAEITSVVRALRINDALGWMGLRRRRRDSLTALAHFGAGFAVGAGAGLLLAPMSGSDLRDAIWRRITGKSSDEAKQTYTGGDTQAKAEQQSQPEQEKQATPEKRPEQERKMRAPTGVGVASDSSQPVKTTPSGAMHRSS